MNLKRAIEARDSLVSAYRDIWSSVEHFGATADTLHEQLGKARDKWRAKGMPQWALSFADGYSKALGDKAYAGSLIYGGYIAGVFYSTHPKRDDYYQKHGFEPSVFAALTQGGQVEACGHYWQTPQGMRPFYIGPRDYQKHETPTPTPTA